LTRESGFLGPERLGQRRRCAFGCDLRLRGSCCNFQHLSTAALIGEGYDLPRFDTLFMAMPLSFKGLLIQYAGRLHREHAEKDEIHVYDYVDQGSALTAAMFRRRSSAYRQMGYVVMSRDESSTNQLDLPV
jgi:superfamily II DNA or RNA helicase